MFPTMKTYRTIPFLVALIMCFTSGSVADAKSYSVAMEFKLAEEGADCSKEDDKIQEITVSAFTKAGYRVAGASANWQAYSGDAEKGSNMNENPDFDVRKLSDEPEQGQRRLCDSFCRFMCLGGQLQYCKCCSCCGTNTRKLRVTSEESRETIEAKASAQAKEILEHESEKISCLAYPYEVVAHIG